MYVIKLVLFSFSCSVSHAISQLLSSGSELEDSDDQ